MSAKSLGTEVDSLFWPGFVDAISCLVLNLLFLTMVLTIAVFVLGQGQSVHQKDLLARQIAEKSLQDYKALEQQKAAHAPITPPEKTVSTPTNAPKSGVKPVAAGDVRVSQDVNVSSLLSITFNNQAVAVPDDKRSALIAKLREIDASQPGQAYELHIATDTTLADERRYAYSRAMAVRDLMMEAGIRPLSITLRMESGGAVGDDAVMRIYLRKDPK